MEILQLNSNTFKVSNFENNDENIKSLEQLLEAKIEFFGRLGTNNFLVRMKTAAVTTVLSYLKETSLDITAMISYLNKHPKEKELAKEEGITIDGLATLRRFMDTEHSKYFSVIVQFKERFMKSPEFISMSTEYATIKQKYQKLFGGKNQLDKQPSSDIVQPEEKMLGDTQSGNEQL